MLYTKKILGWIIPPKIAHHREDPLRGWIILIEWYYFLGKKTFHNVKYLCVLFCFEKRCICSSWKSEANKSYYSLLWELLYMSSQQTSIVLARFILSQKKPSKLFVFSVLELNGWATLRGNTSTIILPLITGF